MRNILGYQVQHPDGRNWGDRPSYEILSVGSALGDLHRATHSGEPGWHMIAIAEGDIEEPTFEEGYELVALAGQ